MAVIRAHERSEHALVEQSFGDVPAAQKTIVLSGQQQNSLILISLDMSAYEG